MDAEFSLRVEPERDLVVVTLLGFFTVEDVARFTKARDAAHLQLRCRANQHLTLVDVRGMRIQSQESVAAFQQMLANPGTQGRAIAFVVSQTLARMQAKRAVSDRVSAYFQSSSDAEDWLFSQNAADGPESTGNRIEPQGDRAE